MNPETKIYIKLGGRKYSLPVNPEEIEVKHTTVDQTENVVGVGEILIPQKPGLREISWSGFFPGSPLDPYVGRYTSPRKIAKALEQAWRARSTCRLVITRSNDYDTNMTCVVSDWSCSDKGGEPDDLYYSVTFRELRSYGVQQLTVVSTTPAASASGSVDVTGAQVVAVAERPVVGTPLVVGAAVQISGPYYTDSTGLVQAGTASGLRGEISRIEDGTSAPYRIGSIGWVARDAMTMLGSDPSGTAAAGREEITPPWDSI